MKYYVADSEKNEGLREQFLKDIFIKIDNKANRVMAELNRNNIQEFRI
jgi:hypothetical protein